MGHLPSKWTYSKIGDVAATIQYGYTASSTRIGEVRFLRITDIQNGEVLWENVPYCDIPEKEYEKYALKKNDIVFVRTGATVGKSFLIEDVKHKSVFASYLIRFTLKEGVLPKYIKYFFNSPLYWNQIFENVAGIGQPNFNSSKLANIVFPLAPLPEQKRIVAKLDTLFAHLDQLRARLDKIPVLLKQFRQAVLTQAVTGELTEEWRSRRNSVPFDDFLPCQVTPNNYESKFNVPSWTWATVSQVSAMISGYAFKSNEFVNSGIQVIRMGNLFGDKLDLTRNPVFLPITIDDDLVERFSIKSNDILLTLTGTKYKRDYGYAVLVPELKTVVLLNQRILSLRPVINPKFLLYVTRSDIFREQFFGFETGGVNQGNVGTRAVASIVVPVPPMNEQEFVAGRVQSLFAIADRIEKQYELLKDRISCLPEAVLKRAFAAQLLTESARP